MGSNPTKILKYGPTDRQFSPTEQYLVIPARFESCRTTSRFPTRSDTFRHVLSCVIAPFSHLRQHTPATKPRSPLVHGRRYPFSAFFFLDLETLGSPCAATPITRSLILLKPAPCSGFVQKSAVMSSVGHHLTVTSFFPIRSVIKKILC